MGKIYCPSCNKETQGEVITREETFNIRGDDIKVNSSIAKCKECAEEVFDEELDENNIELAYNEYRKKHNLLTPSQIRGIREKYDLSQRALATLLGWGEITIHRYESGGIQDEAHNEVLILIEKPENMKDLYDRNANLLSSHTRSALKLRIYELVKEEIRPNLNLALEHSLSSQKQINEFTGYTRYDLEKIKHLILYMLSYLGNSYKTKLNKLLWHVDFLYFKVFSNSITGNSYTHSIYGPTFDDYELILGVMYYNGLISKEEVCFDNDISGDLLKSVESCDVGLFNELEKKVINFVLDKFKNVSCGKISEISHNELPYKKTAEGEKISYQLAGELSLNI